MKLTDYYYYEGNLIKGNEGWVGNGGRQLMPSVSDYFEVQVLVVGALVMSFKSKPWCLNIYNIIFLYEIMHVFYPLQNIITNVYIFNIPPIQFAS